MALHDFLIEVIAYRGRIVYVLCHQFILLPIDFPSTLNRIIKEIVYDYVFGFEDGIYRTLDWYVVYRCLPIHYISACFESIGEFASANCEYLLLMNSWKITPIDHLLKVS